MKFSKSKLIIILLIAALLLSGAYFVLGGFGRSGPDSAPNLAEYGLVGYWNMEEGKGQTVYDRSGNGNNGTLGASTAVAKDDPVFTGGYSSAGAGGTALKFDGIDDYVDAGNAASIKNFNKAITVEAWVKLAVIPSSYAGIVGKWDAGAADRSYVIMSYLGKPSFWVGDGTTGGTYFEATTALIVNTWYYLTGVYDGTNVILYKNGVSIGSTPYTGIINASSKSLIFGRLRDGTSPYYFNGSIDEVRIYNRALSADEIRQHYNQKKPILEWKFDEGSGTTTRDESFNNNDGTLHE